jgi:hypothetical protein
MNVGFASTAKIETPSSVSKAPEVPLLNSFTEYCPKDGTLTIKLFIADAGV